MPAQSGLFGIRRGAVLRTGPTTLDAGGDFADGVISYEGSWLGAETFVSFDKEATEVPAMQGPSRGPSP
jgi:predicted nucleic-acid-binding protein